MGLDSVEIVMGWEEALGVTITDAEAASIRTPGTAINLLCTKLGATNERRGACLSLRAFNRLRRGLVEGAGLSRNQITPKSKLRELLPDHESRSCWNAVQIASRLPKLPKLEWVFGMFVSRSTISDLVHSIICATPKALKSPDDQWTRQEIRTVVRAITSEISGAKDFSDKDDFIKDIGID